MVVVSTGSAIAVDHAFNLDEAFDENATNLGLGDKTLEFFFICSHTQCNQSKDALVYMFSVNRVVHSCPL